MFYELSHDELANILQYINDEDCGIPPDEAAVKFQNMFFAFQRKLSKSLKDAKQKNSRLEKRLLSFEKKAEIEVLEGNFEETGYDSLDIAYALLYQLQVLHTYRLSKVKLICIIYEMYCSWLNSKKQRLFLEHPVATEWGPQFWRIYKNVNIKIPLSSEVWVKVADLNPGIAKFIKNSALKYHDYSENVLKEYFIKSPPYQNSKADRNGGKWNKEIKDSDIYLWRKSQ